MFYVWLSLKIISTFYTIFWDFKMDFGFFAASNGASGKNGYVLAKMFIMLLLAFLQLCCSDNIKCRRFQVEEDKFNKSCHVN